MRFRLGTLGLLLASAAVLFAGSAVAGDDAKDSAASLADNWTGFNAGVNDGFGKSDPAGGDTAFDGSHADDKAIPNLQIGQPKITVYGTIDAGAAFRAK
jgi:hypothetical protein